MTARILASVLLLSTILPAAAAGDNVILVAVSKVDLPSRLPGLCNLSGIVSGVREGTAFHPGQPIALKVPCSAGNSVMTPANAVIGVPEGPSFISADVLSKSREGLARVDDSGALIWGTGRSYYSNRVEREVATGYRVLDGVAMPVAPAI